MKRSPLQDAIAEVLHQGELLLNSLRDGEYTRKLPTAFGSTVGGHYRHCLDHFRSLLDAASSGDLNYDHRERGTLVENDRFAALNATRELIVGWHRSHAAKSCWLTRWNNSTERLTSLPVSTT